MENKPRRKRSPYRSLIAIPIQLAFDVFIVYQAFKAEIGSRPEGVLGHPTGMATLSVAVIMFLITLVVAAIALVIMAVRLRERNRDEE